MKHSPNPKRAVVYTRVSTLGQDLSPEAQVSMCATWAAARGIEVVAVFHEAVSGAAPVADRPVLLDALGAMKPVDAGVLLVAKRDRLARDVMAAAVIEAQARKVGGRVESADGVGEGNDPSAALMRTIIDAFAQYERAQIAARTRAALAVKRARGERTGMLPLGSSLADDGVHLVHNESEARMVARARELRAAGVTVRATAAQLTAEGHRTRAGGPIQPTTIQRIARAA